MRHINHGFWRPARLPLFAGTALIAAGLIGGITPPQPPRSAATLFDVLHHRAKSPAAIIICDVVSECVREHRAIGVIDRHGVGRASAGGSGGRVHLGHGGRVVGLQNVPPPPLPPGVGTQWITTPHSACATGANKTAAATAAASAIMALRSRAGSPLCVDSAAGMNATGTLSLRRSQRSLRTSQRPSPCGSTR
jgi:hypothetical protein